jgi:hypothetical protein
MIVFGGIARESSGKLKDRLAVVISRQLHEFAEEIY